jgi:hypothetical protein
MVFWVNLCFFVLVSAGLSGWLILPSLSLHMANACLAVIKKDVNKIINLNRNNLEDIDIKIKTSLANNSVYDLVNILASDNHDFKVIELEFRYKALFQDFNTRVKNQKLRFVLNDV